MTSSPTHATAATIAKSAQSAQNFYNYAHSLLVLMLWILPGNMPVLIVWFHNLAVRWLTPFPVHDNLLAVIGYIALVETMASGKMVPRVKGRFVSPSDVF
jgi:GR25 family glycosyltransferase involved in LPS biosynthesis